ncbi:VirD4-like conjugal transfer protein, CD1115 family [Desulfofundulus luciae]
MRWLLSRVKEEVYSAFKHMPALARGGIMAGTSALALGGLYLLDVWTLGTAAAWLHGLGTWLKGQSIFATPAEKAAAAHAFESVSWYWSHPFKTAWAWLTTPSEKLSAPEVRSFWLLLNAFAALGGGACWWWLARNRILKMKNNSNYVHGLKVIKDPALGLSRWAGLNDLVKFCEFGPPVMPDENPKGKIKFPGGNLIGELDGKIVRVNFEKAPVDMPKTAQHAVFFGGTGSGKTFSIVITNIIAAVAEGQSIVVIDPKGEIFETVGEWLKQKGYENIWVLNFMTPQHSHRWNPVIECLDDAEISEMIDTLSKNAISESSYFALKGMELAEAMIGLLKGDFPIEQQHIRSLMTLAAWPVEKLDSRFREAYKAGRISPLIYERWRGVVRQNYEYAVSNLTAVLKNLTTAPLAAMMSQQEIDLRQVGFKKTALFLIIPTGGEGVYLKPILSIFYKFLFKRLDKLAFQSPGKRLPVNVRNIWDEMANVGRIPGLTEIISTARSKGIHIQMILQTPSQLESVYGEADAKTIIGNCPTVMLAGIAPADMELARMFSQLLGTAAVETEKVSKDVTTPVKHWFEPEKRIQTAMPRPLMTPTEILQIDPRYGIALLQWSYPLYLRKVGWTELPQAKEIKQCGMLPVERVIPARDFEISLPEIEVDGKVADIDASSKTATEEEETTGQSSAVRAGVPW